MWHNTQKLTLLTGVYLKETTLSGRGHKACGKSKLMDPAEGCLVWESMETSLEELREWHCKVEEATRPSVYAPTNWLMMSKDGNDDEWL